MEINWKTFHALITLLPIIYPCQQSDRETGTCKKNWITVYLKHKEEPYHSEKVEALDTSSDIRWHFPLSWEYYHKVA